MLAASFAFSFFFPFSNVCCMKREEASHTATATLGSDFLYKLNFHVIVSVYSFNSDVESNAVTIFLDNFFSSCLIIPLRI